MRVLSVPGKGAQCAYALDCGVRALEVYSQGRPKVWPPPAPCVLARLPFSLFPRGGGFRNPFVIVRPSLTAVSFCGLD